MILGAWLMALGGPATCKESSTTTVVAGPLVLFAMMHTLGWLSAATKSGWFLFFAVVCGLWLPALGIMAYSVFIYRTLMWCAGVSPWPDLGRLLALGGWLVGVTAPPVWMLWTWPV